ncbi:MAG TPA: hypothetical protein VL200_01185 [Lacunisphaera sp.]|jgi:hypothetical protein|nr:hypothetical protein [Lacunisphaera sp.]
MKTSNKNFSLIAAGITGVALLSVANSAFVGSLPVGSIIGAGAALVAVVIAVRDYTRPVRVFDPAARVLHPTLPVSATCPAGSDCAKDRLAA